MRPNGVCRGCSAPIRWVRTTTGKRMPLDPDPDGEGNCVVDHWEGGDTVMKVYATPDKVPATEALRYLSHFSTCPNAFEFRR